MNNLEIIYNYKENDELRLSFNQLANSVFGIDFENYYQSGFWKDRYLCYSYLDNNKVVSNVSANLLDLVLNGERFSAVQIGTVMTHPEYRDRGLAKELMNYVLQRYESSREIIYLFANQTVLEFYPKFGFKPIRERQFIAEVKTRNVNGKPLRKLDMSNKDDLKLIIRLAVERKPVSQILGVENAQHLLFFYCLYAYSDDLYYLEDLEIIIIFKVEQREIHIYDVISHENIGFDPIINRIAFSGIDQVVFHYTPDYPDVAVEAVPLEGYHDTFFVRSQSVEIPEFIRYPIIAHA